MRKLLWFTVGFSLLCALGVYCYTSWYACLLIPAVAMVTVGAIFIGKRKYLRYITVISLGATVGICCFLGYHTFFLEDAAKVDGAVIAITAEVSDYSCETEYGTSVKARIQLSDRPYQIVVYLDDDVFLTPGDRISGTFRMRLTHEGLEEETYHRGNGVFLLAYDQGDAKYIPIDSVPLKYIPAMLRYRILNRLDGLFPDDTAFFTKALLLGDRRDVDYETATAFKVSGISHIIAVSGLHVSILFSLIYMLTGKKRSLTAIFGIPVLVLFAAAAGFTPSVTRACVMQILMILAMMVNREYDPPTALSAAVLFMLLINPVTIASPSFQLSVGCMAGIFLFSNRIGNWLLSLSFWKEWKGKSLRVRMRKWICSGISVTLSAMFFTTPLVAYYFGCISLVGVITNLLTLWAVSLIFYGIVLVCAVSLVWMEGAAALAWVVSWIIRYVLLTAKIISKVPFSAVYTRSVYIVLWLVFSYVLLLTFWGFKLRRPVVLIGCISTGLLMAMLISWIEPGLADSRIMILDVGQGQCILLQSQGKTYMVDCGGDSDKQAADIAAETLLSMGITRLDGLVLTHYDRDHVGGAPYLLSRISAERVFVPSHSDDVQTQQTVLASLSGQGICVQEDLVLSWDGGTMKIFAPLSDDSDNERSLCVLFRGENCDILITGDLSAAGERSLLNKGIPRLTGLVAGHHGAETSTCTELLEASKPAYVFISAGKDNLYGHPHSALLERLKQYDCVILRTDLHGDIVVRR